MITPFTVAVTSLIYMSESQRSTDLFHPPNPGLDVCWALLGIITSLVALWVASKMWFACLSCLMTGVWGICIWELRIHKSMMETFVPTKISGKIKIQRGYIVPTEFPGKVTAPAIIQHSSHKCGKIFTKSFSFLVK